MTTLYCAPWVIPNSFLTIAEGAIAVDDARIVAVGSAAVLRKQFPASSVQDFKDSAIIPGLINAHTHLELTLMRGFLEKEESDFFSWLRKLTIARLELMTKDDLYVSAAWGACEAARAGVTCVSDASDSAATTMKALTDVGLRGIVFQESFGPDPKLVQDNVEKLRNKVAGLRQIETPLVACGVSPHAPYTVCAPQLEAIARFATDEGLPLMMHAAETEMEVALLRDGRGPFADGLRSRGIEWKPAGISTIQYLNDHGVLQTQPLLAHCIQVNDADIDMIRETETKVAHCPKSNAKLGHGVAPFRTFLSKGIAVGLGSDSVASNNTCDLLEEARFAMLLARATGHETNVNAQQVFQTATMGGARTIGLQQQIGELAGGLQADFAVVSLKGTHQLPIYDVVESLILTSSGRDVTLTVVAGREVYRDGKMTTVDEDRLQVRLKEVAAKIGSR